MSTSEVSLLMTGLAVLGSVFTLLKIWDDWRNLQALRKAIRLGRAAIRGARWWIATASLVSSLGQLGVWAGFLMIGLTVLSFATPAPSERTAGNLRILYIQIWMEATLASIQIWQIAIRSRVRRPRILSHVE